MGVYVFKPHPGVRGSIPGSTLAGLHSLGGPGETSPQQKKNQKNCTRREGRVSEKGGVVLS